MDMLIGLLANGGKLVMVGIPASTVSFNVPGLVFGGKRCALTIDDRMLGSR